MTVNWGFLGAGFVASRGLAPAVHTSRGASLYAVASRDEQRSETLEPERVHATYDDLLADERVDAVYISLSNSQHLEWVTKSLEAGKHVLCEKPLAVSTREVRAMGQLADKKKLKLMTAQHQRFTNSGRAIKGWADAGNLGDVYHARVRAMRRACLPVAPGFIDDSLSGGGPCMDIGVHALDLCMWLMGCPQPVRVTGTTKVNFAQTDKIPGVWGEWDRKRFTVEDFAAGFVHFDNGATMTLEAAWLGHQTEKEDMSCQVFGMDGGVKWPSAEFATVTGRSFVQGTLTLPRGSEQPHWEEIRAFYDCVVNKKPSPVPWTETIRVIAILEAVYKSQKTGREVVVKP